MAQFIGLVTLNAENFDSGAATDGQVLTADGAGGAAWEAAGGGGLTSECPAGSINVTGAEDTRVNGIYLVNSTQNGKVDYIGSFDSLVTIYWNGSAWIVDYDGSSLYANQDNVATPDLVSSAWKTWAAYNDGVRVSGAGNSSVNGDYGVVGTVEGRPSYQSTTDESATIYTLFSDPDYLWFMDYASTTIYYSADNVATPDLVTTWELYEGAEPVPTVATIPDSALSIATITNFPVGYVPAADGSGSYAWGSIQDIDPGLPAPNDGDVLTYSASAVCWQAPGGRIFSYSGGNDGDALYAAAIGVLGLDDTDQNTSYTIGITVYQPDTPHNLFTLYRSYVEASWGIGYMAGYTDSAIENGTYMILGVRVYPT